MNDSSSAVARVELAPESSLSEVQPPFLLGHSQAFSRLLEHVARVAVGEGGAVLLRGERGSGRALAARAIHRAGPRARGPFVAVSCEGSSETMLEVDLFGCVRDAVGASCDRHGVLDMAHGGSVLLENIDEMSPRTQHLLTRFLETGEVLKVGARGPGTPADVRIFASTGIESTSGARDRWSISENLRAHFLGAEVQVPSLRERRDDIPILADYFARAVAERLNLPVTTFAPQAHSALEAYSWPGNVAELKQVVERVVAEARFREVRPEDLPVGIRPRLRLASRAARGRRSVAEHLLARLVAGGESFWACVYPLFMRREITRMDVRDLVRRGLHTTKGNHEALVRLFNMPAADRARFERFLRRYQCEASGSPRPAVATVQAILRPKPDNSPRS